MATAKAEAFTGEIRVASRIIDYLSSGLYQSPAACLKELINNSYDADAAQVSVFVKPDAERIIIEDDGDGMTSQEFRNHLRNSRRRPAERKPKRPLPECLRIGQRRFA